MDNPGRCRKAGVPEQERRRRSKVELALEMVRHQRESGVQFAWVGADGCYGIEPAFLRGLDAMGEMFVVDVYKDRRILWRIPSRRWYRAMGGAAGDRAAVCRPERVLGNDLGR